ncbi:PepSY-associated TM helix domain-containing protein [Zhouia sp. PK063]|uniref:PepSY-associated TM helix domain-containing protein n=1 Tax=Zhouia sp. PK063 TaxID=3373602 RepID=UPI0037A4A96D
MATTKKKRTSTFQKMVAWLHLWPSIVSGIIVVFVCLTGTIVVYGDEIMDWSAGEAKYIVPQENYITYHEIAEHVHHANPSYMISEVVFFKDPHRSLRLRIFNPKEKSLFLMYMNPYTGKILKEDHTIYFFFITAHLHAELLAGPIGGWVVIISTIIFFISGVTGLLLWWPKKWTKATKKASFTIKWKAKFKRLNYDLHNVLGFYSLFWCVLLSATGLLIFFHSLMTATIQISGGDKFGLVSVLPKADSTKTALDMVPLAHFALAHEFKDKQAVNIWIYQVEKLGAYVFTGGKPGLKSVENADIVAYDKYTGKKWNIPLTVVKHEQTENIVWQLHMGQWWGQFGKLSTFISGLIATSLPITGFLIWWGRRKKSKKNRPAAIS